MAISWLVWYATADKVIRVVADTSRNTNTRSQQEHKHHAQGSGNCMHDVRDMVSLPTCWLSRADSREEQQVTPTIGTVFSSFLRCRSAPA